MSWSVSTPRHRSTRTDTWGHSCRYLSVRDRAPTSFWGKIYIESVKCVTWGQAGHSQDEATSCTSFQTVCGPKNRVPSHKHWAPRSASWVSLVAVTFLVAVATRRGLHREACPDCVDAGPQEGDSALCTVVVCIISFPQTSSSCRGSDLLYIHSHSVESVGLKLLHGGGAGVENSQEQPALRSGTSGTGVGETGDRTTFDSNHMQTFSGTPTMEHGKRGLSEAFSKLRPLKGAEKQ